FTRAGALALKTRVLLFAASPLFNSADTWSGMANEAVSNKIVTFGSYDPKRWQDVIKACEAFLNENGGLAPNSGHYQLHQNSSNYALAYRGAYLNRDNSEMLISTRRRKHPNKWWAKDFYAKMWCRYNGVQTPLDYVNAFPWADGTPFKEADKPWKKPFVEQEAAIENKTYKNVFLNRDPRLGENVFITGQSYIHVHPGKMLYEGYVGGAQRGGNINGKDIKFSSGKITGFSCRKFIFDQTGEYSNLPAHWPYMRLTELYLNYAEALVMVGRASEAYKWVDAVRARVGMKPILEANPEKYEQELTHPDFSVAAPSDEFLLKEILRERALEFYIENIRPYDLNRWRCAKDYRKRLHGLLIWAYEDADGKMVDKYNTFVMQPWTLRKRWVQDGTNGTAHSIKGYRGGIMPTVIDMSDGNWSPRYYLSVIPESEIVKDYGLIQNPGW
ncbi:MAG: RagB/SusD family nutrient uptake outer membrane protein, partial [Cytophagales bacterium]|nr:RagB/SusD family nutrient uptake outer membrane protein [Cytophagales bacterium]